ncbi:uncharacterized protein LOC126320570 isoform X2 [Schistocerca gregaria]|uniref:uncharacterized protein LOC126320570 isoform X2 n=1 Tax=Schistocerca gregaria TaxID=7010 RepID=UPI00211E7B7A|nr:uncharacterized protein LOC126320570 isoform X2 [Schistocerca gregaria]
MSACLDAKWRAHLARSREGLAEQRGEGDGARSAAQEVYEKSTIFAVRQLMRDLEQLARSVVTEGAVGPAGLVAKVVEQWAWRPSPAAEASGGRVGSKDEKVILAWKKCVEEIEAMFQRGPAREERPAGDSPPSGSGGAGSTEEASTSSAAEEPARVDPLCHSLRATIENVGRLLDYARWRHLEIPREMYEDKEDHVRVTHIDTLSGRPPSRYTVVQLPGDASGSPSNGSGMRSAQGAKTTLYRFLETVESATDGLFFVSEQSESYLSKYLRSFRRLEVESLLSGKDCILFASDRAHEERHPSDGPSAEVEAVESSALELDERAQAPQPSGLYFTHTCSYRPRKLSFSLLSVFERCAFQFLLKYVLHVQPGRTETAVFSVTGSVIHKLVADAEGQAPASDAQVLDEASLEADAQKKVKDAVVKKLAKADSLTVGQALEKVKEPVIGSEIRAMTRTLKRVTIESQSNKKKSPSSVSYSERKFQVKVLDNVLLIGCWDRVNVTGEDVEIIEYKRVLKNSSKDEISKNMQLMLYAFAWWKMTGVIPKRIVLQQLLHKDLVFAHSPTREELEALEHKLYSV